MFFLLIGFKRIKSCCYQVSIFLKRIWSLFNFLFCSVLMEHTLCSCSHSKAYTFKESHTIIHLPFWTSFYMYHFAGSIVKVNCLDEHNKFFSSVQFLLAIKNMRVCLVKFYNPILHSCFY